MERPIITLSEGKIQGVTLKSALGTNYVAFKGIPYAQSPIGLLRFEKPQPPLKWSGIRDASKHAGTFPIQNQFDMTQPAGVIGSEDCLYVNVYTNIIGKNRPVMFWVHGGGFVEGAGRDEIYGEDFLVNVDIVLVIVGYRVGPMGFLNLGHEVAPGNQALRDIILALKWTQKNIELFGGDPNNVTIFGNSSGAMTCHLLSVLPATKGLFHKMILQSGLMYFSQYWKTANSTYRNNFKNGFKIASLLGMDSDDPIEVVEFLRSVPAEKMVKLRNSILPEREHFVQYWLEYEPVIDADYTNDPVVPLSFPELLKNNVDIPIIVGHTAQEALLNFSGRLDDGKYYKFLDDNIEEMFKYASQIKEPNKLKEVMKDVRVFYLKNKPINRENLWNAIDLLTDIIFVNLNRKFVEMRAEYSNAPTYLYRFSYTGLQPTVFSYDHGPQALMGLAHGDELSYLFYATYMWENHENDEFHPAEGTKDRFMIERMIRLWFNFASTGNPTPKLDNLYVTTTWKSVTKENLYYLDIGEELVLKDDKYSESRFIYEKYGENFLKEI